MKLKNRVFVKTIAKQSIVLYTGLCTLAIGLVAFVYFNFNGTVSLATDNKSKVDKVKVTGNSFRILQNGIPIDPIMGVAVNSDGIFEMQVRNGVDLQETKTRPIAAEVSITRGTSKVSSMKFNDINNLKSRNLQPWITSYFQAGDKLTIELFNTVLEPDQAKKVYSLAMVY